VLFAKGKVDEALHEFSEAVRYKPNKGLYRYNYGVLLYEKGREQEGIDQVRMATELDPGNKQYRDGLALLISKQKR
jgi:Tfp pilus assembly protein PilF